MASAIRGVLNSASEGQLVNYGGNVQLKYSNSTGVGRTIADCAGGRIMPEPCCEHAGSLLESC